MSNIPEEMDFQKLSSEEMTFLMGRGNTVSPMSTPATPTIVSAITDNTYLIPITVSAVGGLVSYTKRCL